MTTSEFIKMLQKEDPEGTAHIRMNGDIPWFAELKPGYWDGPYNYINTEGKWVQSRKGSKVDIQFVSTDDLVIEVVNTWNPFIETTDGLWKKVLDKFVIEDASRYDNFIKPLKETYDFWVEHRMKSETAYLNDVIKLYQNGCRFFRLKETKNKWYYGWKFINETNPKNIGHANTATTYPILMSDKFEEISSDEQYYEYILK